MTRINSFQGAFDEYLLLGNYLYGVHIISKTKPYKYSIKRHGIRNGEEKVLFEHEDILDFCCIKGKDLYAFRDYSNSSVYIINEDGQVKAKFDSPANHQILGWVIDENGYVALGFRVEDKYLIRIYKIEID